MKLILLNELGVLNKILINQNYNSGEHEAVFDLSLIPNGVSFLKHEQEGKFDIKKIIIVK